MASAKKKGATATHSRKAVKRRRRRARKNEVVSFERLLERPTKVGRYVLKLFVTGTTPRSASAIANIRALCEHYLPGRYDLEVIDIYQQPEQAAGAQIIAAPTLIKELPTPLRRIVGDLSHPERIMMCLDLGETAGAPA